MPASADSFLGDRRDCSGCNWRAHASALGRFSGARGDAARAEDPWAMAQGLARVPGTVGIRQASALHERASRRDSVDCTQEIIDDFEQRVAIVVNAPDLRFAQQLEAPVERLQKQIGASDAAIKPLPLSKTREARGAMVII